MDKNDFFNQSIINCYIDKKPSNDLSIIQCGFEKCKHDKVVIGPVIFKYYTLHYIISGEGVFKTNNKIFHLKKNDVFIIFPGTPVIYYPIIEDPWSYCWIDFLGIEAASYLKRAGLTLENPIFNCPDNHIWKLFSQAFEAFHSYKQSNDLMISSCFYQIISYIIELTSINITYPKNEKEKHILKAIKYIDTNYNAKTGISAKDISNLLGLNVNYFSRLFKEIMGTPFSSYLTQFRLQKAIILFQHGIHSVKDVSNTVGFNDPLYFSKVFKKQYLQSPTDYTDSL